MSSRNSGQRPRVSGLGLSSATPDTGAGACAPAPITPALAGPPPPNPNRQGVYPFLTRLPQHYFDHYWRIRN
ncbi:hypothetical protein LINPERHAP1_LOCUS17830, partial [Linum perenne]